MSILQEDNIHSKTIAIVLTDIIGSTKFVQKAGNLVSTKWFKAHDKLCISLITRFNGVLSDSSDGFLMYFYSVHDAIAFAFFYKKKLIQHKFPFKTRIGIHWDKMLIVKNSAALIAANHKKISLDGIGKNVAARAMSVCNSQQIILTHQAYMVYKSKIFPHPYIPKNALTACIGLYKFKGVSKAEQLWAVGTEESHLQPPESNEKVKRIAGPKKIRIKLRHKKWQQIFMWAFWRFSLINLFYLLYEFWPLLSSERQKKNWGIDYSFLTPFEYIQSVFDFILRLFP